MAKANKARAVTAKLVKAGMRYVRTVLKAIPAGLRLVHNFEPGDPDRIIGADGFRAYLESAKGKPAGPRYLCRCGWAPHLKRHYDADGWH